MRETRTWLLLAASLAAIAAVGRPVLAYENNISIERTLSEILQDKRLQEAKARGDTTKRDVTEEEAAEERERAGAAPDAGAAAEETPSRRALLPDVGYSPETGGKGGLKFTDRDIEGLTLDVSGSVAQKGQDKGRFSLVAPDVLAGWLILLAGAEYKTDPTVEFFGLGNNEVGPDEVSTNRYRRVNGRLAVAVRLEPRLLAVLSGEFNDVQIRPGDHEKQHGVKVPFTTELFPNLVGINGGQTSPISLALIYDDRDEVTRPVEGWNAIAKYQRIDKGLGNRFEFNRYIGEVSYLYPLITRRQVLGVRVAGEYIDSRRRGTPFFEFSSLGGGDDMRGYFQNRFLGKSKLLVGGEYRLKVTEFDFFRFWHVKVDGVAFFDAGRVWLERDEVRAAGGVPVSALPPGVHGLRTNGKIRLSYGPGLRFELGEALVARVDFGFSSEGQALSYVTFSHTF